MTPKPSKILDSEEAAAPALLADPPLVSRAEFAPSEDQLGNGIAERAVRTSAILKSGCQGLLNPQSRGVFVQGGTREGSARLSTGTGQQIYRGNCSLRSHLNDQSGSPHPNLLDATGCPAPHLLLPVLTIHTPNVSISILCFFQHIP